MARVVVGYVEIRQEDSYCNAYLVCQKHPENVIFLCSALATALNSRPELMEAFKKLAQDIVETAASRVEGASDFSWSENKDYPANKKN